jgi:hypothetical protein
MAGRWNDGVESDRGALSGRCRGGVTPELGALPGRGNGATTVEGRPARALLAAVLLVALLAPAARADEAGTEAEETLRSETTAPLEEVGAEEEEDDDDEGRGIGRRLLFYVPNRIFDVFDLVRARVRVGPGLAVGIRATELADLNLGAYTTLYAGLPGPRGKPRIPLPVGVEVYAGAEVSVVDVSTEEGPFSPSYGPAEIGLGFQAAVLGLDLGIEPWDFVDLVLGLVLLDPNGDDF